MRVGGKGMAHTNAHNSACALLPAKEFPKPGGPTPMSNFDHSGPAMELLLLGNLASLVGQPFEFDPVACKIPNNEDADGALHPSRREGWAL